jgi:HSP20 family protein
MTLVKFNNRPLSKTIDSVFDELFTNFPSNWNTTAGSPAVNIHETKDGFHLELNAAGLNKEDIKVNIENGLLTVSFEKKEESKSDEYKTIRREFGYRSFTRSFNLDDQVDADNVQAKYENGILKLFLPKREPAKASTKQVSIQ